MNEPSDSTEVNRFRSLLGVAVFVLLSVIAAAGLKSYSDLDEVRAQETELQERLRATKESIRKLDRRIERIQNDPVTLEAYAREQLGMVRAGDLVIVLPEPESEATR